MEKGSVLVWGTESSHDLFRGRIWLSVQIVNSRMAVSIRNGFPPAESFWQMFSETVLFSVRALYLEAPEQHHLRMMLFYKQFLTKYKWKHFRFSLHLPAVPHSGASFPSCQTFPFNSGYVCRKGRQKEESGFCRIPLLMHFSDLALFLKWVFLKQSW